MRILFGFLLFIACDKGPKMVVSSTSVQGFLVQMRLIKDEAPQLPPLEFDPDLVAFRDDFDKQAKEAGAHIDPEIAAQLRVMVVRDNVPAEPGATGPTAGLCLTFAARSTSFVSGDTTLFWKEIHVDRDFVAQYGMHSPQMQYILFHELFHCRFNKVHLNPLTLTQNYAIMFPSVDFGNKALFKNLPLYIGQMFTPELMSQIPDGPSTQDISKQPGWEKLKF